MLHVLNRHGVLTTIRNTQFLKGVWKMNRGSWITLFLALLFTCAITTETLAQGQPPQPARAQPVQEARAARPQVLAESMPSDVVEAELVEPARRPVGQSAKPGRQRRPKRQSADRSGGRRQRQTDVDQADDKMAAHMHQVFDHDIGSLHDTSDAIHEETDTETTDKVPEVPGTVEAIRQMLAGPESAR